ncbi:MAG: hypothetical protein WBM54_11240 [Woeseia sp.]
MRRTSNKLCAILVSMTATLLLATGVQADNHEWPLVGGYYWEVTGIDIKDGGAWNYANWLATEWRKNEEFAKSKGWIKDYMIVSNVYSDSDADLYLIRVIESVPSGVEGQKRAREYRDWVKKSAEMMVKESGNRAEFREVLSSSLLQVMTFRD